MSGLCGDEDQTQGLMYVKQAVINHTTSLALRSLLLRGCLLGASNWPSACLLLLAIVQLYFLLVNTCCVWV